MWKPLYVVVFGMGIKEEFKQCNQYDKTVQYNAECYSNSISTRKKGHLGPFYTSNNRMHSWNHPVDSIPTEKLRRRPQQSRRKNIKIDCKLSTVCRRLESSFFTLIIELIDLIMTPHMPRPQMPKRPQSWFCSNLVQRSIVSALRVVEMWDGLRNFSARIRKCHHSKSFLGCT